jgi:hypothetical protein
MRLALLAFHATFGLLSPTIKAIIDNELTPRIECCWSGSCIILFGPHPFNTVFGLAKVIRAMVGKNGTVKRRVLQRFH